ncbi:MAG: hypothetical protein HUK25_05555, partial [Treponema sp.]|nr:hypothetical protein [Clostridia bacterium]MCF0242083.1 hypothetical protein [Treponema sp.]
MNKKRVLFAGNGFNSLDRNYVSWTDLIKFLFKKFGVYDTYLRLFVNKVSPYMQYELLAQAILDKNGKFDKEDDEKIRFEIASLTSKSLESSSVHTKAVRTYNEIITLNYDSCFENAALLNYKKFPPAVTEKIFQLKVDLSNENLISGCKTKSVWHAHGAVSENGDVNSICMWFQTYIQNVAEIKLSLNNFLEKMLFKKNLINSENIKTSSWFQLFFTDDIDIIGTELSYSELDVWWILTSRARLIREGKLKKGFNRIRYFMLRPYKNEKLSEEKISKIALLKSMDIEIVFISPEDYFT